MKKLVILLMLIFSFSLFAEDLETTILKLINNDMIFALNEQLGEYKGASLTFGEENWPVLIYAIISGRLACAEVIINQGIAINDTCESGELKGVTPLHLAVMNGYDRIILNLLYHGADVNKKCNLKDFDNISPIELAEQNKLLHLFKGTPEYEQIQSKRRNLVLAIQEDDTAAVQKLLSEEMYINYYIEPYINSGTHKWSPLMFALSLGNLQICRLLLEKDKNVNRYGFQYGYMSNAIASGNPELVKFLLDEYKIFDKYCIFTALGSRNLEIVKLFLPLFDDISVIFGINGVSVLEASLSTGNPDLVWHIFKKYKNDEKTERIFQTVYQGDTELFNKYINSGLDVNMECKGGMSLLCWASFLGNTEIVKILLEKNARSDMDTIYPVFNPIWHAVANGHIECVKLLAENGANLSICYPVGIPDEYPLTLVDMALIHLGNEMAEYLIKKGAYFTINLIGYGVYSHAMNIAIKNDNMDFIRFLVEQVDRNFVNCIVPLRTAINYGKYQVIDYFIEQGYDFNHYSQLLKYSVSYGDFKMFSYLFPQDPLLHMNQSEFNRLVFECINYGDLRMLKKLYEHGFNINLEHYEKSYSYKGKTLLFRAAACNSPEMVRYLIRLGADIEHIAGDGSNPLYCTVLKDLSENVEVLINAGVEINKIVEYRDYEFESDYDYTIYKYGFGYDNKQKIARFSTALDAAQSYESFRLLREAGAKHYWEICLDLDY